MKKLLLLSAFIIFACSSDDSSDTNDNDCNQSSDFSISCSGVPYASIVYGTQEWTVENACHTTYRDGTPIPQVTDDDEWTNLTTGAWCYYDNDPTKGVLYNWYAVKGIHDNDPNTPNKEFAPTGWHVPSHSEWITFEEYLIDSGYNSEPVTPRPLPYFGNVVNNYLGKSLASTSGWNCSDEYPRNYNISSNQSINNNSGFNAFPTGWRFISYSQNNPVEADFFGWGSQLAFWSTSIAYDEPNNYYRPVYSTLDSSLYYSILGRPNGCSVRLVKD